LITALQLFFLSVAAVPPRVGKQVFETKRGIARVTSLMAAAKIFIKCLPGLGGLLVFEALAVAMGVSDYLFDVFCDCF
jgi:predicted small integral membrane protein